MTHGVMQFSRPPEVFDLIPGVAFKHTVHPLLFKSAIGFLMGFFPPLLQHLQATPTAVNSEIFQCIVCRELFDPKLAEAVLTPT